MELVEAEYLAPRRVATSLRKNSESALRRARYELVEVARPWRLVDDLVETHVAVTLARHVHHSGVVIVVRKENACRKLRIVALVIENIEYDYTSDGITRSVLGLRSEE